MLGAGTVCAIIRTGNFPSIRVAGRLGMRRGKGLAARYFAGGMRHYLYSVQKGQ